MRCGVLVWTACAALAQTAVSPLRFEVASVKPAPAPIATKDDYTEGFNAGMRAAMAAQGMRITGDRVTLVDKTLKDLVRIAYEVKDHQVVGPSWITAEKYQISAIMPRGSDPSQAPGMLRALLQERFHLELHREVRNMAAYALVALRGGPKLTAAAEPETRTAWAGTLPGRVYLKSASLATFADQLTRALERPVVNETGIAGLYEFDLKFSTEVSTAAEDTGPAIAGALQQLGLRLEKRDQRVDVWVVDRADKVPVEN